MSEINYNDILEYRDGRLFWKIRPSQNTRIGDEAGYIHTDHGGNQYRYLKIKGKCILAHRVIYEMHFGSIPHGMEIDHKDCNGLNNLIDNLRLASHAENGRNRKVNSSNTSGLKGICWHKRIRKWQSRIKVDGRQRHLGYFNTKDEAYAAYCIAAKELHKDFHRIA